MLRTIQEIGDFIFIEDKPEKCDAIMIVGGSHPELGEKAADLWKCGYAPLVFASGGVSIKTGIFPGPKTKADIYFGDYNTEFDFLKDVLIKNGVINDAIHGENRSGFTRENALFTREVTNELGYKIKKAILVCKTFHARRSLMFYQLAFPDTDFLVVTIDGYDTRKDNWYKSDYGIKRVMGELSRCGNQFVDDFIKLK